MTQETLDDVLKRRGKAEAAVMKALNHLPRSRAMSIILSYIPISDLERSLPTITGSEPPITDPFEALAHRIRMECIRRGIELMVKKTRNDPSNTGKSPQLVVEEILREAIS